MFRDHFKNVMMICARNGFWPQASNPKIWFP